MDVDAPDNPSGEHWIDISLNGFQTNIAWRPAHGFGVYTSDTTFGEGPDEVYKRPEDAVRRVLQLEAGWRRSGRIERPGLRELRDLCRVSQTSVAARLGITQVAISRLESRQDVKLSSLFAYVEALGGRLEVRARFDGFDVAIGLTGEAPSDKVRAKLSEAGISEADVDEAVQSARGKPALRGRDDGR